MKLTIQVVLGLALCGLPAYGQAVDENLKPKTPPPKQDKAKVPETPAAQPTSPDDEVQVTENLVGLVFVRAKEDIKREKVQNVTGVDVQNIPLLSTPDFAETLQPYLGKPAKLGTLKSIQREVILYSRAHDRPLVDVIVPNQDVDPTNGVVQIVFIEGRVGKVTVRNEGKQWFKEEAISKSIRLQPGDAVSEKRLMADIDWLNRNPFRDVTPSFRQGDQAGLSDLQLDVRDRIPLRVFAGYEDSGTEATGRDRLLAGFNWGNAFSLGHQLNYQYSTDAKFETLMAHSASYIAPLPWRHIVSVYGTYVDIDTGVSGGGTSTAINYQAALRYSVPLPILRNYQHEAFAGLDFKHNETDLLFGGTSTLPTVTEVLQLVAGYNGSYSDPWGRTSAGIQGFYSPGDLTDENDDFHFNEQHTGAEANYYYGRLTFERVTRLPRNFSWVLRGGGQLASGNLIPSEQLGVGGYNTVRGYDEREANGDRGFVLSTEVRTPAITVLGRHPKWNVQDQLQFLAFMDYGLAENVNPEPDETTAHLWSVGGGLRYTISRYLTFRFDYGVQLRDSGVDAPSDYGSRAHIGVVASF
jgi:hemolysin activation/secretion protein